MLAELSDRSNVARAFSFLPLVFLIGQVLGFGLLIIHLLPYSWYLRFSLGGFLSRPQDRWPDYFPQHFWAQYPYSLPCLVVATFSFIPFALTAIFFEEVGFTAALKTSRLICRQDTRSQDFDDDRQISRENKLTT